MDSRGIVMGSNMGMDMLDDAGLPRGPYKGKAIEDVPTEYLQTIVDTWSEEEWVIKAESELAWRDHTGGHFDAN